MPLKFHGTLWKFYETLWKFHGTQWKFYETLCKVNGTLWKVHGFPWNSIKFQGIFFFPPWNNSIY
jgi:hypothetical protein